MKIENKRRGIKTKLFIIFSITLFLVCSVIVVYINWDKELSFPVQHGTRKDYDQHSFGAPRVGHKHRGVDIFAPNGTPVLSATSGIVIFTGILKLGGNVVLVLGPDLRMYYYAHLDTILTNKFSVVENSQIIGRVGKTGNAQSTPPHLHFSISKIIPFNGKRFYDPVPILNNTFLH
jgi:murein DD-endopeptidase MepM/ murein hydrolase activator NlpD